MCILGVNLSNAFHTKNTASCSTISAVVVGKMIVMPIIGILTTLVLKNYVLDIPSGMLHVLEFGGIEPSAHTLSNYPFFIPGISSSFYLVLMVVTITPTANGVMVMVELTRSSAEASISKNGQKIVRTGSDYPSSYRLWRRLSVGNMLWLRSF
jgi:predicted permease